MRSRLSKEDTPGGPDRSLVSDCEKPLPKRPTFFSDEFKEEKINYLLKGGEIFGYFLEHLLR